MRSNSKMLRQLLELEETRMMEKFLIKEKKDDKKEDEHKCFFCALKKKDSKKEKGLNVITVTLWFIILFPFIGKAYYDLLTAIWK